MLIICS